MKGTMKKYDIGFWTATRIKAENTIKAQLMKIIIVLKERWSKRNPQTSLKSPLQSIPTLPMIVTRWSFCKK